MKKNIVETDNKDSHHNSRRNFLANTAIAGAGLILTPLWLSACSDQPENNKNQREDKLKTNDGKMMYEHERQLQRSCR
jgi:hypothetical protein